MAGPQGLAEGWEGAGEQGEDDGGETMPGGDEFEGPVGVHGEHRPGHGAQEAGRGSGGKESGGGRHWQN